MFFNLIILPDEVTKFPDVFLAEASGVRALSGGRHEIGDVAVAGGSGAQKRTETKCNITFNRNNHQRSVKKPNVPSNLKKIINKELKKTNFISHLNELLDNKVRRNKILIIKLEI